MNNRDFDKSLKEKLDIFDTNSLPAWDKMASKIEDWNKYEPLVSDDEFDSILFTRLENNSSTFKTSSWLSFESFLSYKLKAARQVIYVQISGALIFILILLLVFQLFPFSIEKEYLKSKNNSIDLVELNQGNIQNKAIEIATEQQVLDEKIIGNVQNVKEIDKLEVENSKALSFQPPVVDKKNQSAIFRDPKKQEANLAIKENKKTILTDELIDIEMSKSLNPSVLVTDQINGISTTSTTINIDLVKTPVFYLLKENKEIKQLNALLSGYLLKDKINLSSSKVDQIRKKGWFTGIYAIPQYVFIDSPDDQLLGEPGYQRFLPNLGGGIFIAYKLSKIDFSIGAEFHSVEYQPRFFEEYVSANNSYIHLKSIACKILVFPISVNYHFASHGKFNWYAKAGFSITAIANSEYDIQKRSQGLTTLINDLKINPSYKTSLIAQKDYEEGIMKGGSLNSNILSAVDLGFGVEYQLSKKTFLFMEPMIHYQLKGKSFGPNHDQFQRFSINFGAKINL